MEPAIAGRKKKKGETGKKTSARKKGFLPLWKGEKTARSWGVTEWFGENSLPVLPQKVFEQR